MIISNRKSQYCLVVCFLLWAGMRSANALDIQWGQSQWIGCTQDDRPAQWSARDVTFNRPPADIASWKPTASELRSRARRSHPSPLMRKMFQVVKPVQSARVAVCGLGLYELYLNGEKVGDRVLDPAQTTYDKRAFYVVHDVTSQLQSGSNVVGVMLGNGFYGQNIAFVPPLSYGPPRTRLVLEIGYVDGSTDRVESDESWRTGTGPVLFDNIYLGETFDARRWDSTWSDADFDAADWHRVEIMKAPTEKLIEQRMEPMRKIRAMQPVAVRPAETGWIIDMGQNITGWLQIRVNEPAGTVVKMRFAEHLMPDKKNIDTASTGIHVTGADQTDIYICRGGSTENWEPRFTYHGFRYVQVEGLSQAPDLDDFTGWLVRTDVERIGSFECSDPLINKFYDVSIWTIEDNLQGILTDCPHRERCAWMGDMHAVAEAASFTFDLKEFWRKTSADMETVLGGQAPHEQDGVPQDPRAPCNIAVGKRLCKQARPDWGAATVLVPWFSYIHYGDREIVAAAWPMMVGWMAYLDEEVAKGGIIAQGYGDWCPPDGTGQKRAPVALTSTALYYQSLCAMEQMALALSKTNEAIEYAKRADVVKHAFHQKFFNAETGGYGTQTGNALAIHCGLTLPAKQQAIADQLAQLIMNECGGRYTTGIFGHRPLYTVLNDHAHAEVTRHLWQITDYPSLGFFTEVHDLTTWPESPHDWDITKRYRRNSFNHPMHSGFAATFYESLGGIRPDVEYPGFNRFFLKPCFLPDLRWAKVTHRAPQGLIASGWTRENGSILWSVTVPAETTAQVQLPAFQKEQIQLDGKPTDNNRFHLESGSYTITLVE